MYRLYERSKGLNLIDISEDETDIIETIGERIGLMDTIDYIVIDDNKGYDDTRAVIHSVDDYVAYKYNAETNYRPKIKIKKIH